MSLSKQDSDDQEVFEIEDYTTASDWERFTASIEELIQDWQLSANIRNLSERNINSQSKAGEWLEKKELIKFSDYPFYVIHHYLRYPDEDIQTNAETSKEANEDGQPLFLKDLMDFRNDFPDKVHGLVRWYGLKEFVTVVPANPNQPLLSPSKAKVVLSSLALAASNTNCEIPLFVQVNSPRDKVYMGVGVGCDSRTDFEMAYVCTPPPQCTHLSGLLDVFKSKIGSNVTSAPVMVSIRFTYILRDWPHTAWCQEPPDLEAALSHVGFSELGTLPFGALSDPISELYVSTTWPYVNEYNLIDSEAQSDLNPSSAPMWTARLGSSALPPCLLSEYISEYVSACDDQHSIVYLLGSDFDPNRERNVDITNALHRLTASPLPTFSTSRKRYNAPKTAQGPLSEEMISLFLNYLFPDSNEDGVSRYNYSNFSQVPPWILTIPGIPAVHPLTSVLEKVKSCSVDSFVWRLCIIFSHIVYSLGGLPSVAHFLYEVLEEFRFRWDNALLIPGATSGFPDMSTCIVNQKIQMLNCCIQRRIKREETANKSSSTLGSDTGGDADEFFDCDEDDVCFSEDREEYSPWDKPEGRQKRFGKARLLSAADYLYVPITQEPAPYTEDTLEEQTGEFLRLGSDALGSHQRARLMSASLLSDMESFKAANPKGTMEDFVRWYSPRDWIEEESQDEVIGSPAGRLSDRMLIPGNLWVEVWENAKPVPARRQKRLFDDTQEAEKVLRWFTEKRPGELCLELWPVLMHASLCRIAQEPILYTLNSISDDVLSPPLHDNSLVSQLELIAKRVSRLARQPPNLSQLKTMQVQLETIERAMAKALSLRMKFLGHSEISPASLIVPADPSLNIQSEISDSDMEPAKGIENELDFSNKQKKSNEDLPILSPLESLVTDLLRHSEVVLEGGPKGLQASIIKKLFADSNDSFKMDDSPPGKRGKIDSPFNSPQNNSSKGFAATQGRSNHDQDLGKPEGREFILRSHAPFPVDHSRTFPQRLYAVILKNSFRLSGAITQDTLFC